MCNAAASSLFLTITLGDKCCCESSNDSTDEVTKAQKGRWSVCAEPRTEDKQRQDLDSCFYLFHQPTEHPRPGQQGYRNQNPRGHGAQSLQSKARHLLSSSLASGWQSSSWVNMHLIRLFFGKIHIKHGLSLFHTSVE